MQKPIEISTDPQGWVKLQRSLLESPIMKNPILLQIYIWSRLKANHKYKWFSIKVGKGTKEIFCNVGQFITGRKRAAKELGIPESTFYKNIKRLADYGYLTIESNNRFSLVTVVNADNAVIAKQLAEQQKKQSHSNNATAKEQQKNTNNNNENRKKENEKTKNEIISNSNFIKKSKLLKNENLKIQNWVISAYQKFLKIIARDYPIINSIPQKLSRAEFEQLFSTYDWQDILVKCDAIEKWEHTHKQKSTFKILAAFLTNDNSISELEELQDNSYLITQLKLEKSNQHWENEKRERRLADGLYDGLKYDIKALYVELKYSQIWNQYDLSSHNNSKRKVIRSYLRFKFLLGQRAEILKAYNLDDFTIVEYLKFVDTGFTYESLRYYKYLDQFALWPKLKSHKNIFKGYGEFLCELMGNGLYEHT